MRQFTRGLAEIGAEVLGVGDGSPDPELRRYLADYLEVPSIMDEEDVIARVHDWLRGRSSRSRARELGAARHHRGAAARAVRPARHVRRHGARLSRQAADEGARRRRRPARAPRPARALGRRTCGAAVEETGYPAIIKPISGAGSADTYKVESATDLARVLPHMRHVAEAICEEFIDGEEYTYDTASHRRCPGLRERHAVPAERARDALATSGSRRSCCRSATSISRTSAAGSSSAATCCAPSAWATA